MQTLWGFTGEKAKEKLSPYEQAYELTHVSKRKNKEIYEMDLENFEQYRNLEILSESLDLDLTIVSGAEWLAVLYEESSAREKEQK